MTEETQEISMLCQKMAMEVAAFLVGEVLVITEDKGEMDKHINGMMATTAAMVLGEMLASIVPLAKEPDKFLDKIKEEMMHLVIGYAKIRANVVMKEEGGADLRNEIKSMLH